MRTGKVMALDGDGRLCAVPAFASGWLTVHRPGAEVLRFRREDVLGVRPEGVLPLPKTFSHVLLCRPSSPFSLFLWPLLHRFDSHSNAIIILLCAASAIADSSSFFVVSNIQATGSRC